MARRRVVTIFAVSVLLALTSCGGGGSSPSLAPPSQGVWDQMNWDEKNWQ